MIFRKEALLHTQTLSLFVTCTRYLEELLADELKFLKAGEIKINRAGVSCAADLETAYRICLWSRIAGRVLLKLSDFEIDTEQDLYQGALSVEWNSHFSEENTFMVDATLVRSFMKNENFTALKVKDAVADYFRNRTGRRPSVDTSSPDIRISAHVDQNSASLYLDLSGDSLFKRGYRLESTKAPLRENSAAAMLAKAGWKDLAEGGTFFLDPMCGSGTLLIEAALMAGDCAPGLIRKKFGFSKWKPHEPELWARLVQEARQRRETGFGQLPPLFAADIDPLAVAACRGNIGRAGLEGKVQLSVTDFRQFDCRVLPRRPGFIAVNPPYGVRLENKESVRNLYQDFGRWMQSNFTDSTAAVLSPDKETAKCIGLRADRLNTFYNGNLKIQLALFTLSSRNVYVEQAPQEKPSQMGDDETTGIRMIVNRLKKNKRILKKYLASGEVSCYRIYDADIPQYSAAIDIYEDTYAVVQEYAAPKTIEQEKAAHRLREILEAVPHCFSIQPDNIFLKKRQRQRGEKQYEKLAQQGEFYIIREGGLKFFVNFSDYLDTGIFLDHRMTRDLIRRRSMGARVLNLFAYTCTASVYAADGGAVRTVSVDTSAKYLEWGRKNFGLNRIPEGPHLFQRQDCLDFLRTDIDQYDLIFIDPPTFSNRKGAEDVFDVQRDHVRMIDLAARRLSSDGVILFSNNFRKFLLDPDLEVRYVVENISMETIPRDFERNSKIHRVWLIRRKSNPAVPDNTPVNGPPGEGFHTVR